MFEKAKGTLSHPVRSFQALATDGHHLYGNAYYLDHIDSVHAIYEGKVVSVFKVGDVQAIIIKFGDYFISYAGCQNINFAKGDYIYKNEIIGTLMPSEDGSCELTLIVIRGKGAQYVNPNHWIK